jgi:NAD(P)-dependent dehydrogenase (short-subunit alcohol dehydrogenase family)
MKIELNNKRAVVTGSTAGIGFAIAAGLARAGADVVINGRTEQKVDAADLASAQGVADFVARAPETDILVNNLGIFEPKPFEEIPDADWTRFFETNVMSGVRMSRNYLPGMKKKNWGRIVFISSESALNIPTEMIHYGMTKTAQLAIARGLAERTRGTGVTVNSVLPGPTGSEGVREFVRRLAEQRGVSVEAQEREFFATARPSSLLARFASPEEVANMIVYVSSAAASATNGAALRVDGGVVRAIV